MFIHTFFLYMGGVERVNVLANSLLIGQFT